ncbi:MAG: division plane positioning ATPase MipZ [Alphaproteobacteria bacterium]
MTNKKSHVIVISNEKGGVGKSSISMHLSVKLLQEGFSVATLDFDGAQASLTKYIENRKTFCDLRSIDLPMPTHFKFAPKEQKDAHIAEISFLVEELSKKFDAIIIDTPGGRNYLFDLAHSFADTLITPISDSLIDLSSLADIDYLTGKIKSAGHYASFVWDVKKEKAKRGENYLNWIVVGNKISSYNSNNKKKVFALLEKVSKQYGFRYLEGMKDRTIYKELFLQGLTVLDFSNSTLKQKMSVSHLAAKREVRAIAEFICPEE